VSADQASQRGQSALFWTRLNLHGRFERDVNNHLDLPSDAASHARRGRTAVQK
jgi:hypothetical protein